MSAIFGLKGRWTLRIIDFGCFHLTAQTILKKEEGEAEEERSKNNENKNNRGLQ